MQPLCFVLMPFGRKTIASGTTIDFDAVYQELIAPAIAAAGMEGAARRRGGHRWRHPQADVRAADPL
jgi:hypothetical protein